MVNVTSELKLLMRRCYEWEKDGLKYRKEDAFKIQANAKEAYHSLERANKSFFGQIRIVFIFVINKEREFWVKFLNSLS